MRVAALLLLLIGGQLSAVAQEHSHSAPQKLGSVHFATSCEAAVQPTFDHADALLHSFQFGAATEAFNSVLAQDPSCTVAYWGIALSAWGNPMAPGIKPTAALERGRAATTKARAKPPKTSREQGFVEAVARLYDNYETVDQRARVNAYEKQMEQVAAANGDDSEAQIFYALSLAAAADPADKTYANQLKAGAILEKLFAQQPDHPGLAHYIIHAYDVPPLAGRAVSAARRYATIAPDAPHALHMPSHTFTRIGSWQESIDTNIAAAASSRRVADIGEELHATDYMTYAYLQSGQDEAARRLIDGLAEIRSRFNPNKAATGSAPTLAAHFALAAIPARYALERGAWEDAAKLEVQPSSYPFTDAITWFARGIGSARSGDVPAAQAAAAELAKLRDRLTAAKESYWGNQVEIERRGVSAWTLLASGKTDDALREMRAAADMEDATEKSAVTPGPIAPAREMLGEMLLQSRHAADAEKEFAATLSREPHRFRSLSGAIASAIESGDPATAKKYRADLLETCKRGDQPGRPELAAMRRASAP